MPIYQTYNKKIKAWVKFEFIKGNIKFIDVKQNNPEIPFKNIKVK